jgi:hypothetical protein
MHKIQQVLVAESWKCEFQKLGWEIRENHDLKTDFTDDLSRIWMINSLGKYNVSFSMNLELSITFKWALNPLNSIKLSVILVLLLHYLHWKAFRWLIAYRFLKQSIIKPQLYLVFIMQVTNANIHAKLSSYWYTNLQT